LVYLWTRQEAVVDIIVSRLLIRILALAGLSLLAAAAGAQRIQRWVDKEGIVHYGDSVPPEQASQDRDILNSQGVKIGSEQGEITEEERAAMDAEAREKAEHDRKLADQQRHDRMLLDTFVGPEDIERLRDRRLELIDAQIRVFEIYLGNLRKRHDTLIQDAGQYAPRNEDENAPPLPEFLGRDIENTEASIHNYEALLQENRQNQEQIRKDFEQDIRRFRELKRLPPPAAAETASTALAGRELGN
jgi:Domain of unknown function (DUF4124)